MPLQPSRKDVFVPPPDVGNLGQIAKHQGSYLRSLEPGFLDGRWRTPQKLHRGEPLVGEDDGGGSDTAESVIGEDGDRLTLTHLGTQTWALSYVPVSETLHLHWHPGNLAGVEWKRGEHYDLSEEDNIVTIYASSLATALAQVGDTFSAQYLRYEGEQEESEGFIDFKAGVSAEGTGLPPAVPLALPVSTDEGDLVIISGAGVDVTDPRFTLNGVSQTWYGYATDLSAIAYTNTGFHWAIAAAVFSPGEITDLASAADVTNPGTLPQVESQGIVIAGLSGSTGSLGTPTGFTLAVEKNQGVAFVKIAYLYVSGTSPAATFTTGTAWFAGVLTGPRTEVSP